MRVVVAYHFFAHYREPVFRALAESTEHEYWLYGGLRDPDGGIEPADMGGWPRFRSLRAWRVGRVLIQPWLPLAMLNPKFDAAILLGDAQHLTTWPAALLARLTGKKVLFWTHGWTREDRGPKAWVRRTFYRLAHGLLLYGNRAKAIGEAQGFDPQRMTVIYNSLDYPLQRQLREQQSPAELAALRQELFRRPERPIALCVSRLTTVRRLDLLIEAAALLKDEGRPINILLVGDGPERAALEALARERGVDVTFTGACYDEALLCRYTMISTVTVAPGKVGLTAMQSLAYGTPVITHGDLDDQMPEVEAVIPGVTGDFFERGNVADLAWVIGEWTSASKRRANARSQAIAIVESTYNPQHQVRIINSAIDSVAGGVPADMRGDGGRQHPKALASGK